MSGSIPAVRRAAVLGSPIAHSLSPVLHRAAYAALGLDWHYDAIDVSAEELPDFIASRDSSWVGLSLTMPLKEAVLPLLDEVSDLAQLTRAANTVLFSRGRRIGDNTDVTGIQWALRRSGAVTNGQRPLRGAAVGVIGAGATARSAIAALAALGASAVAVSARRNEAVAALAELCDALQVELMAEPWVRATELLVGDLVVSTVPAGAADWLATGVPTAPGALLDVVYSPWPTPLAKAWRDQGGVVVGGLELLVGQAADQVRLMTGSNPPIDQMLAAGRAALQA